MEGEHRERMRVAWVDTDASGRIHFTAAFRWAELAVHAVMRDLPLDGVGEFPRRHVEATFHRPLRYPDEFDLVLAVERVGRSSVTFGWRVERGGEVCVEGHFVVVLVGENGKPKALPETFRKSLAESTATR